MHGIIDIPTENLQDFDDIALFFGLGKVKDVSGISTGYSNKNFLVRTNIGAYVFRFIKKYNTRIIENEIAINTQLKGNGRINTNYLLSNNTGEFVYQRNGIVVVVSEKIEGAHPIKITDEMSFAIGKTLGEFHKCVTYIPNPGGHGLLSFQSTQDQANKLPHSLYKEKIQELLNRAKSIQIGIDLPEGIIHGDLHRENLLISGEHPETIVSILDMEHANSGILVLDIARSIIDICRDDSALDIGRALAFIDGYSMIRPLNYQENISLNESLYFSIATLALWFYKNNYLEFAEIFLKLGSMNLQLGVLQK